MLNHPSFEVLIVADEPYAEWDPLMADLHAIPHVHVSHCSKVCRNLKDIDVLVTVGKAADRSDTVSLQKFVQSGGGWLMLNPNVATQPPDIFKVHLGTPGPETEMRVIFSDPNHRLAKRMPDAFYLSNIHRPMECLEGDLEILLYTDWQYRHNPVTVLRSCGSGKTAISTIASCENPIYRRFLYRLIRELAGRSAPESAIGVGILGYAPSVGQIHGLGVENTDGLNLKAICDLNSERRVQARKEFAGVRLYESAGSLGNDPEVDLVIVATPPNTHADLSIQMLASGKHVVCEKPLALNRIETQAMVQEAESGGLHLSCHQNRRWDVDFVAIKRALDEGVIGELFYMETFVGGYSHPCGYWHSHKPISGGMAYDWGAHYLDWIVGLIPEPIATVSASQHKRVWHDVTNADQERILIRFSSGKEAEFMHSEIAAVRKPKWYLLGTKGAIVGRWQEASALSVDPLFYYRQDDIPVTEMTPELVVYHRHPSGQVLAQGLAQPGRPQYSFHRNLADHLLTGEPLVAPLEDSVRVVAVLEAAGKSAEAGGRLEVVDD